MGSLTDKMKRVVTDDPALTSRQRRGRETSAPGQKAERRAASKSSPLRSHSRHRAVAR
jgi:hypothetical protein